MSVCVSVILFERLRCLPNFHEIAYKILGKREFCENLHSEMRTLLTSFNEFRIRLRTGWRCAQTVVNRFVDVAMR